jgi:hypothetical protein
MLKLTIVTYGLHRNFICESVSITDFIRPLLVQKKCNVWVPAAPRYFLAAISRVEYIKWDVANMAWHFGAVEDVEPI